MVITSAAHGLQAPSSVTVTNASYTASTGVMTLTVASHGFKNNDWVKLADGAVTFTCAQDSDASDHAYPRASDPISKKFVQISNVTTNTFDIQVLDNAPSTNTSTHVCTAIAADAVRRKKDRAFRNALEITDVGSCLLYTSPSPRDRTRSRMPSSA